MKKLINWILSLFKRDENKTVSIEYTVYTLKDYDYSIVNYINEYRISLGLSSLVFGENIVNDICAKHCNWLSENVSNSDEFKTKGHFYANDRFEQVKSHLGDNLRISECVSYNYINPKSAVQGFKKSPIHNEIITGDFDFIGIASKNKFLTIILYKNDN